MARFESLHTGILDGTHCWLPGANIGSQKNATPDTVGNDQSTELVEIAETWNSEP